MYLLFAAMMLNACVEPSPPPAPRAMPAVKIEIPQGPTLAEKSAGFKKNKTTYSEVIAVLGEPAGMQDFNGEKWIAYSDMKFDPTKNVWQGSTLSMRFNEKDVLYFYARTFPNVPPQQSTQ
ncbi:MAG TPA: hypothetical protein VIU93_11225 [Gallionellaceae bacterium]